MAILSITTTTSASPCIYQFKKNGGQPYESGQVADFVTREIRSELKNEDKSFFIEIKERCQNKAESIITLRMSTKNYYILGINGQTLPKHVVDYNNRLALNINHNNFYRIIGETSKQNFLKFPDQNSIISYADRKELLGQQRILKMYAFVFAEAARFESAEKAVRNSIDGKCTTDWHNFDYAVHNWKNLSVYVQDKKTRQQDQITGGGVDQLIAPIKIDQELEFDRALMKGEKYEYSIFAPLLDQYENDCQIQ